MKTELKVLGCELRRIIAMQFAAIATIGVCAFAKDALGAILLFVTSLLCGAMALSLWIRSPNEKDSPTSTVGSSAPLGIERTNSNGGQD